MVKKEKNLQNPSLAVLIDRYSDNDIISLIENDFKKETIINVPLEDVTFNPLCKHFLVMDEDVIDMTQSIKENGILLPLLARKVGDKYEVISGYKRFFVARKLKLKEVPLMVRPISDELMIYMVLKHHANDSRISILNKAYAYRAAVKKFGISRNDIAIMTHQSLSHIVNSLRILKLSKPVLDALRRNEISFGHARVLVGLKEEEQEKILAMIIKEKLSVRAAEDLVSFLNGSNLKYETQQKLEKKYDIKVRITKNRVTLDFPSEEELDNFIKKML